MACVAWVSPECAAASAEASRSASSCFSAFSRPSFAKALARSFNKRGIDVLTGVQVTGHSAHATGTTVHIEGAEDLDVEAVVVSIGRRPFADHLGLEGAGVAVDQRGFVEVNDLCQTNTEGVYALGDLIATPQLAHVGEV